MCACLGVIVFVRCVALCGKFGLIRFFHIDPRSHTHIEDEYQSITKFDIDAMEGESFSPPMIEIVGAKVSDALFPEDDVIALEIDG